MPLQVVPSPSKLAAATYFAANCSTLALRVVLGMGHGYETSQLGALIALIQNQAISNRVSHDPVQSWSDVSQPKTAISGWHYLSNATCLIQASFVLCVFRMFDKITTTSSIIRYF